MIPCQVTTGYAVLLKPNRGVQASSRYTTESMCLMLLLCYTVQHMTSISSIDESPTTPVPTHLTPLPADLVLIAFDLDVGIHTFTVDQLKV